MKSFLVPAMSICIVLVPLIMGCQTERTATVFGFSQGVSDSATDPERLNRELEDTLRQSELKRLEKLQTAPRPTQGNRE